MHRHTLIATAIAAVAGAGAAAGAGAIAAPSHHAKPCASKAVRAVRQDVRRAVSRQASGTARPVIEKAQADGRITDRQAARLELGVAVRSAVAGKQGAARSAAAKPILDRAVAARTIPARAETRILARLEHGPMRRHRRP